MKPKPEYVEGPKAWKQFDAVMKSIIAVPHSEMQRRIEAAKAESAKNPSKPGPKPKNKRSR